MGEIAALTTADLYVIGALTTLALAMWLARLNGNVNVERLSSLARGVLRR